MRKSLLSLGLVALVAGACGQPPAATERARTSANRRSTTNRRRRRRSGRRPRPTTASPTTIPGINPFVDPDEDRDSTFGLDVDTASYTVARRYIDDGNLPDPASVRVEEFVNFFDQGYARARGRHLRDPRRRRPEPVPRPATRSLLRIGLKARDVGERARPDAALTFVIDVSGSMAREDRLELVKRFARAPRRGPPAATTRSRSSSTAARPGSSSADPGRDAGEILDAIDSLQPEGSTNAEAGLRLGYELARETFLRGRHQPRRPRLGRRRERRRDRRRRDPRPDPRRRRRRDPARRGRRRDGQLQRRAARAARRPGRRLLRLRRRPRRGAPAVRRGPDRDAPVGRARRPRPGRVRPRRRRGVPARRLREPGDRRRRLPRSDGVDAGAIGAGHAVTALYALRCRDGYARDDALGTVRLRWTEPGGVARVDARPATSGSATWPARFRATDPTFQLDAIVAAAAERFRGSGWGDAVTDLRDVVDVAASDRRPAGDRPGPRLPRPPRAAARIER